MSENEIKPVYPKIDHMQLDADGGYYCRHVAAMTDEGLHRKSEIAGQLGMRDRAIDRLTAERDALRADAERYRYLRDRMAGEFHVYRRTDELSLLPSELDADIDAARAQEVE